MWGIEKTFQKKKKNYLPRNYFPWQIDPYWNYKWKEFEFQKFNSIERKADFKFDDGF